MQIQSWEGAALSGAETVLQGTTHDTVRGEIGYGEKVSQRLWSKMVEEEIGLTARHKDAERLGGRRVFELERVVSCGRAHLWGRTKLDLNRANLVTLYHEHVDASDNGFRSSGTESPSELAGAGTFRDGG
jgi:hypothetical protein